jgi:acyl-CoA synthetase (AMP-forming)/AMP-acid ligase II
VAPGNVMIFTEDDQVCPPGVCDERGRLINYRDAVGEIVKRVGTERIIFDGYFANAKETNQKFRDGHYHTGDIGHIRVIQGKRYLYFNGRTDDWIRKDGENFSAENVLFYAQALPGVDLAIAYGVPCEVSDEKVMVAIQLYKDAVFRPEEVYQWYKKQEKEGGMNPKWMPDYIRIIESFPLTDTQKIPVRLYKREHFNIELSPEMRVYCRMREDTTYRILTKEKYAEIRKIFEDNGRKLLLEQR